MGWENVFRRMRRPESMVVMVLVAVLVEPLSSMWPKWTAVLTLRRGVTRVARANVVKQCHKASPPTCNRDWTHPQISGLLGLAYYLDCSLSFWCDANRTCWMAGCHSLPVQAVGGRGGGCIGDPCWVSVKRMMMTSGLSRWLTLILFSSLHLYIHICDSHEYFHVLWVPTSHNVLMYNTSLEVMALGFPCGYFAWQWTIYGTNSI